MKTPVSLVVLWIVAVFLLFFGIGNLANMSALNVRIGVVGGGMFAGGVACAAAALATHAVRASLRQSATPPTTPPA